MSGLDATPDVSSANSSSSQTTSAKAGQAIQAWISSRDPTSIFIIAILLGVLILYLIISSLYRCLAHRAKSPLSNGGFERLSNSRSTGAPSSIPYNPSMPYDAPPSFSGPVPLPLPEMSSYPPPPTNSYSAPRGPPPQQQRESSSPPPPSFAQSALRDPAKFVMRSLSSKRSQRRTSSVSSSATLKPLNLGSGSPTALRKEYDEDDDASTVGLVSPPRTMTDSREVVGGSGWNYLGLPDKVSGWGAGLVRSLTTRVRGEGEEGRGAVV